MLLLHVFTLGKIKWQCEPRIAKHTQLYLYAARYNMLRYIGYRHTEMENDTANEIESEKNTQQNAIRYQMLTS